MWLGLHTVSSLERCPLFRVSFIERYLLWQGLSFGLVVFVVLFILEVPAFDWALFVALETESM